MTLYVTYQADIWVEVDTVEEDVVHVVVDDATMAVPVEVIDDGGAAVGREQVTRARRIAETRDRTSWDYGSRPF